MIKFLPDRSDFNAYLTALWYCFLGSNHADKKLIKAEVTVLEREEL